MLGPKGLNDSDLNRFASKLIPSRAKAAKALELETPPKYDAEVGIIGAGAAGLAAAATLRNGGMSTIVWEKDQDIGGRAGNTTLKSGTVVQTGAQYLQSALNCGDSPCNPLITPKVVAAAKIKMAKVTLDQTLIVDGHLLDSNEVEKYNDTLKQYETAIETAKDRGVSVADVLPRGLPYEDLVKAKLGPLEYAVDLAEISLEYVQSDSGLDGDDAVVKGGPLAVIKAHVGDVPVMTNNRVTKIERIDFNGKPAGFKVTANDKTFVVKDVICTVPPQVLTSGKIKIEPELPPEKQKALGASKSGLLNKVVIELDDTFDFKYTTGRIQEANEEVLVQSDRGAPPVSVLMRPNGKAMMVGFVGGDEAWKLEKTKTDDEMVRYFTEKLQPVFASRIDEHIVAKLVTHWGEEGGSYSYIEPGKDYLRPLLAEPVGDLGFAGEYTEANPNFLQQVPNAYYSGVREARRILAKRKAEKKRQRAAQPGQTRAHTMP